MTEPLPYYETPPDSPSRVRLYHGDCRELLPLVAPPAPSVLALADGPYGVNEQTDRATNKRGLAGNPTKRFALQGGAPKGRTWKPVAGDREPFDPSHLLAYPRLLVWGWNHFGDRLPPTPSVIGWDKRVATESDDNADIEVAWTNIGGPPASFVIYGEAPVEQARQVKSIFTPRRSPSPSIAGSSRDAAEVSPLSIAVT